MTSMPYLVYWFDLSLQSGVPHITLEPCGSLISSEFGEKLGLDRVPKDMEIKFLRMDDRRMEDRTSEEKLVCDTLNAYEKAKKSRSPPMIIQPDDTLYTVCKKSTRNILHPQREETSAPLPARAQDPRWRMDLLRAKTAQQELSIKAGVANLVGNGKAESRDKTSKQNSRTQKCTPKKDKNGFFKRPAGRAKGGHEWK